MHCPYICETRELFYLWKKYAVCIYFSICIEISYKAIVIFSSLHVIKKKQDLINKKRVEQKLKFIGLYEKKFGE